MIKTLTTIFALAVASVTAVANAEEVKGDIEAGKQKIAMCIGCHGIQGYQSSFPEVHKVPMISGQSGKYIAASLIAYQKGDRKHPTMRGIAASLTEQDIADLSVFYAQDGITGKELGAKPSREPSVQVAELLKRGACISCHGDNFSKGIDPSYPKLGGQHADYLFVALKSYKHNKGVNVGRNNAIMDGMTKQFSNAELKALAKYISTLDGELHVVPQSRFR